MLHRVKKENDINRDKWIGVGGKLEENESPDECLLREVREETGLRLTDYRARGIVTFVNTKCEGEYMHLYTADGFEGEVKDCPEGELEWTDREKLLNLTLWEGDRIFLKLIEDDAEPFFLLKLSYDGDRLVEAVLNGKEIKR